MEGTNIERRILEWHDGRPSVTSAVQLQLGAGEIADLCDADGVGATRGMPLVAEHNDVVYSYCGNTFVRVDRSWQRVLWTF